MSHDRSDQLAALDSADLARSQRTQRRLAEEHRADPGLEQMASLRESDPEEFDRTFGPRGHITLGMYEARKSAAQTAGQENDR